MGDQSLESVTRANGVNRSKKLKVWMRQFNELLRREHGNFPMDSLLLFLFSQLRKHYCDNKQNSDKVDLLIICEILQPKIIQESPV